MKELFDRFKSLVTGTTDGVPQARENIQNSSVIEKVDTCINYISYAMSGEKAANYALFVTMPRRSSEEDFIESRGYVTEVAKENEKPVAERIQAAMTELRELQKSDPKAEAYAELRIAERVVSAKQKLGQLAPDNTAGNNSGRNGMLR